MTVKKGNKEILKLLNEGIAKVRANGEYDRIYEKWFGRKLFSGYTESEVKIFLVSRCFTVFH